MAAPTRTSYVSQTSSTTTNVYDFSAVANDSWMIAVFEVGNITATITPPAGWTSLLPVSTPQTMGSRNFGIWARIKQSGDTTFTWTASPAVNNRLVGMWGTGSAPLADWQVGSVGVRSSGNVVGGQSALAGTSTTTVAPAITTLHNDSLVLAINLEATAATETAPSSYSGGTEWFWSTTTASFIESAHVLYNVQASPGSVGAVTTTYPNTQASNGAGLQVVIPAPVTDVTVTPSVVGTVAETVFNLTGTGALTYSITMPTGIAVGDYVMVFVRFQSSNIIALPTMTGFDYVGRTQTFASSSTRYNAIFAKKIVVSGDIPGSTVTLTANQNVSGSNRAVAEAFRLTGVDLTNPVVSTAAGGVASGGTTFTRGVSTSELDALDIYYGASEFASPNSHTPTTYPTGFTTLVAAGLNPSASTAVSRTYMYLGYRTVDNVSIPTNAISWTVASGSDAEGISIRGITAAPPIGTAIKNGLGSTVYLSYLDATSTRVAPLNVKIWYPGYPSVTALLADIAAHPTMAHRGGSTNYPEFSQYAYDRAVMKGHGVLEFSCGWTSDTIPFGLASQYLDTAAGLPGGTNLDPTTITWATLSSTYQNKINPVSPGVYQPFYKLADFLAKYTRTHIVCVDPKFGFATSGKVTAMLDICDANGGPTKIIIKFDSPTSNTVLTTAAHARGYQCMNYWGTDLASLATQHSNWDILGYAYNASGSDWTTVLGYGKPTWAAIIPDAAGKATAISSGAGLMMIKDVVGIPPVSYWN